MPVLAAIDAGSNALRLSIAEVDPERRVTPLDSLREPVRLGHDVFTRGWLTDETIDAAVAAFVRFRDAIAQRRAVRVRAVATSAVRRKLATVTPGMATGYWKARKIPEIRRTACSQAFWSNCTGTTGSASLNGVAREQWRGQVCGEEAHALASDLGVHGHPSVDLLEPGERFAGRQKLRLLGVRNEVDQVTWWLDTISVSDPRHHPSPGCGLTLAHVYLLREHRVEHVISTSVT